MRRLCVLVVLAVGLSGVCGCMAADEEEPVGEAEQRNIWGTIGGGIAGGIGGFILDGPGGILPGIGGGAAFGDALTGPNTPPPNPPPSAGNGSSCSCTCNNR